MIGLKRRNMKKILMVYPQYPDTFWSFRHALKFILKKAAFPPLGLLTVAAMLPKEWEKKLVDMNVTNLTDKDIKWADFVFISAMVVQRKSVKEVIQRVHNLGVKIVAGGPLFTSEPDEFGEVDHLVLNEAEITLPFFLADLEKQNLQKVYSSPFHPAITQTPVPLWSLIKKTVKKYNSMSLQYSRGCPFDCEFCDITVLDGRIPRTKTREQVIAELDAIYNQGWRGSVFFVDDNFIGVKNKLKAEILPAIIQWGEKNNNPFAFFTEASINLAQDEDLMNIMAKAGFSRVFVGIETPNEASLNEADKNQNKNRDLIADVKTIQHHGMEVMAGFIVGFDNDPETIFETQIDFIQKSGIVTAMVGLLNAPIGTKLYQRLKKENRLIIGKDFTGDNTDASLNFNPKMPRGKLIEGYWKILKTIYSPKNYTKRIQTFLEEYRPKNKVGQRRLHFHHIFGLINTSWYLSFREKGGFYYWKYLIKNLFTRPRSLVTFINLMAYGYHFRKVAVKAKRA
jgi:radical SAM superfamily enzyme YgiQ (UPF0313 family)